MYWEKKYLKYKSKYLFLKNQINFNEIIGGNPIQIDIITNYFKGAITNSQLIEHIRKKNLDTDKTHYLFVVMK